MTPETRCCSGFIIVGFLKPGALEVVCKSFRLREAVASAEDFEILSTMLVGFAEVVFFNEFLRYV